MSNIFTFSPDSRSDRRGRDSVEIELFLCSFPDEHSLIYFFNSQWPILVELIELPNEQPPRRETTHLLEQNRFITLIIHFKFIPDFLKLFLTMVWYRRPTTKLLFKLLAKLIILSFFISFFVYFLPKWPEIPNESIVRCATLATCPRSCYRMKKCLSIECNFAFGRSRFLGTFSFAWEVPKMREDHRSELHSKMFNASLLALKLFAFQADLSSQSVHCSGWRNSQRQHHTDHETHLSDRVLL